jgi:predicted methyltransferase
MVKVKAGAKVITIEPAQNVLTIERVVELFSAACGHVCALKVVDGFVVSSLARELKAAEVTTVFRRTNKRSGGASGT